MRLIYLLPLFAVVTAGSFAAVVAGIDRRDAAASYRQAVDAEVSGELVRAAVLYAGAGDYADAKERAATIERELEPYASAYEAGIGALNAGDYRTAIELLLPIVQSLPEYEQASALLEQARLGRDRELLREARNAEARQDWARAEWLYALLAAEHPNDSEVASKLLHIRRERAQFVFSLRQRLHLANPAGGDPVMVTGAIKAAWPVWSPDRSRIAFVSPGDQQNNYIRALYVVDADGANLRKLAEDPARWRPPIWSPDGRRIAFEVDGASVGDPTTRATVMVVDLESGVVTDIIGDAFSNGSSPAWSPTGDRIAFVVRGIDMLESEPGVPPEILRVDVSSVHVMTMATGEIRPVGQGSLPEPWRIVWSPASEEILVFSRKDGTSFRQGALYRLDAVTGQVTPIDRATFDISMPVWSPDGQRFAYVLGTGRVRIVSIDGATIDLESPIALGGPLTWSPSSDRLLAMGQPSLGYSVIFGAGGDDEIEVVALPYDSEGGDAGPPQWSAANPAESPHPPTLSGTGLDR